MPCLHLVSSLQTDCFKAPNGNLQALGGPIDSTYDFILPDLFLRFQGQRYP